MVTYAERIKSIKLRYAEEQKKLIDEIDRLKREEHDKIIAVELECFRETGHKDNGGMFHGFCEHCGAFLS